MADNQAVESSGDLARIVESAHRLGVELDEEEALQWLTSMAASQGDSDVMMDVQSGVYGHKVSMLDFSPHDLARFRDIGKIVGFEDKPGVETALALSGSAAQSKIQSYPGDCDYFERVNIKAPTHEEACRILGDLMLEKVETSEKGPNYQMIMVTIGSYPFDCERKGRSRKKGSPIQWSVDEVKARQVEVTLPDGTPQAVRWEDAVQDPGWTKLDWVVSDPRRNQLANASNVLDVTWEAPDGTITPLDGYLDTYFQEVYLEAESIPVFSKLAKQISSNALDDYAEALHGEVKKYVTKHVNYGKAAKRMYNVFRLTGRYTEAAYIRELFDEPATVLYRVWSLITTLDNATQPGSSIPLESVIAQADQLIVEVVTALEGVQESEIVKSLLRLRDAVTGLAHNESREAEVEAAKNQVENLINSFFHERLTALPTIKEYIESQQA